LPGGEVNKIFRAVTCLPVTGVRLES